MALLYSTSINEYRTRLNAFMPTWNPKLVQYFHKHQDRDLVSTGRWILQDLGLYDPNCGITNNASESVNATIGRALDNSGKTFTMVCNALYFLQVHFLLDIQRALLKEGEWNVREEYGAELSRIYKPEKFEDIIDPSVIKPLLLDGVFPEDVSVVKRRKLPNTRDLTTPEGLGQFLYVKNRIKHVPELKVLVVRGLKDKIFTVDLARPSCNCKLQGYCGHLIGVQKSCNLYPQKKIPNVHARGFTRIYQDTCNKATGRKGPSRQRLLKTPKGSKHIRENETVDNMEKARSPLSDSSKSPRRKRKKDKRICASIQLNPSPGFDQMPRVTAKNVDKVVLRRNGMNVLYCDLKTLFLTLTNAELGVMNAYFKKVSKQPFNISNIGWLTDVLVNAFCEKFCDGILRVLLDYWKTKRIVDGPFNDDECQTNMQEDILKSGSWDTVDKIFCLHCLKLNHWVLICLVAKENKILVLDPYGLYRMPAQEVKHLTIYFNRLLKKSEETGWRILYPEKLQQDDGNNCGVLVCFYLECLANDFSLLSPINLTTYRAHILQNISGQCDIWELRAARSSRCYICKKEDPPAQNSNDKDTEWVQCERCDRWCHFICAGLDTETVGAETKFECI